MKVFQTDDVLTVLYEYNLQNNIRTYQELIKTYHLILESNAQTVYLDMQKVEFIAANLFAVLGGMCTELCEVKKQKIVFRSVGNKIKTVMQKNRFGVHFYIESIVDEHHTTIEYRRFRADTIDLEKFEKYIFLNVFQHKDMPDMSEGVRDVMIDNFLEMFNNVIDHGEAEFVYACGQVFPSKREVVLSIVDFGNTIRDNIEKYQKSILVHEECSLNWAITRGNSTKANTAPGGLGFSIILDFLKQNEGEFILISGNEYLYKNSKKAGFTMLENCFPGTIVTIIFNMDDDFSYILVDEDIESIKF